MADPVLVWVDIANKALGRIGERPLLSMDEDTPLAGQVQAVFFDIVDAAFTLYNCKWCRRTEALSALVAPAPIVAATTVNIPSATPVVPYQGIGPSPGPQAFNGWPYAFGFPSDALSQPLGLYERWPAHPLREFNVEGRIVFARHSAVYGTFIKRLAPDQWPPGFRMAVTVWLAAELAVPVSHDANLKTQLLGDAVGTPSQDFKGGLMGRAIAVDAATGGPVAAFADDPLTQARYQGAGNWYGD